MARKSVAEAAAAAGTKTDAAVLGSGMALTDAGLATAGPARFEPEMPLKLLQESPANPRKRFTVDGMRELEESVRVKGVVTPLLVRRVPGRAAEVYEIAAGHRRFRAAMAAGRPTVPVLIRDMPDDEFLELLVMENDQREDVHALEEASGYQALLGLPGYDVAKIAARVGRSVKYVYDRLKLLQLVPAAQKLFLEDRFTAGHAILLARLKPKDQERAIDIDDGHGAHIGGVFKSAGSLPWDDETFKQAARKDPYLLVKPASVREFEAWIQDNVRVEPGYVDGFLFPETAAALEDVEPDKVILVTHDYQAPQAIRKAGDKKVFGEGAWQRADGKEKSKTCPHARVALVACGRGQQEALLVCIAKEKCAVHWAAWQKDRTKRQATAGKGGGAKESYQEQERKRREASKREEAKEAVEQKRWRLALPEMVKVLAAAVLKAPLKPTGLLAQMLVKHVRAGAHARALVPQGKTTDELVRHLAFALAMHHAGDHYQWGRQRFTEQLRAFGIDAGKIVDEVAPVEKPAVQTAAKPGKPVRGTCRKCGCQELTPCAGGCGWADATQTKCTACFPPTLKSRGKKKARR